MVTPDAINKRFYHNWLHKPVDSFTLVSLFKPFVSTLLCRVNMTTWNENRQKCKKCNWIFHKINADIAKLKNKSIYRSPAEKSD